MHKGRLYELFQDYRVYSLEAPYPYWCPASWTITDAQWAGTAAALAPSAPLYLVATGRNGALEACYECPLFDFGGGISATLKLNIFLDTPDHVAGWIGGDWGVNGDLPRDAHYLIPQPTQPLLHNFSSSGTPAEAYLRPTLLEYAPTTY